MQYLRWACYLLPPSMWLLVISSIRRHHCLNGVIGTHNYNHGKCGIPSAIIWGKTTGVCVASYKRLVWGRPYWKHEDYICLWCLEGDKNLHMFCVASFQADKFHSTCRDPDTQNNSIQKMRPNQSLSACSSTESELILSKEVESLSAFVKTLFMWRVHSKILSDCYTNIHYFF